MELVAGPCAAESEEQVIAAARALSNLPGLSYFRAGLWKPRTRPGRFEGVGARGLSWLARVQEELRISVCTEIATEEQFCLAQEYGIESFWIGARTTSDPFSVQQLAPSLGKAKGTIYVKNPISPDLDLWIGALERIAEAGAARVVAVHRGFYPFSPSSYRNSPRWDAVLALRSRCPDIPILSDPSHIAGCRELIPEVIQQAYRHAVDGLFVEVHPEPEKALSDAEQQLTPEAFISLLQTLPPPTLREPSDEDDAHLRLQRAAIDSIDAQMLELLAERMRVVDSIGRWKQMRNLPSFHPQRWAKLLQQNLEYAAKLGLSRELVIRLATEVHTEALRIQDALQAQTNTSSSTDSHG